MIRLHLISLLFYATNVIYTQGIDFEEGTWNDVYNKALTDGTPIFVDIYTDWCAPCKKLEKEVFADAEVASFMNNNFLNYRLDAEKDDGPEITKRWEVNSYPTLIFFNSSGTLIESSSGYRSKEEFLKYTSQISQYLKFGEVDTEQFNRETLYHYLTSFTLVKKLNKDQEVKRYWQLLDPEERNNQETLDLMFELIDVIDYEIIDTLMNQFQYLSFSAENIRKFVKIDSRFIKDSEKAVRNGNLKSLNKVNQYRRKFHSKNPVKVTTLNKIEKDYQTHLLNLYDVKMDDEAYILQASKMMNKYILSYSVEEINRADGWMDELVMNDKRLRTNAIKVTGRIKEITTKFPSKTKTVQEINEAISWIDFAIEIMEDSESYLIKAQLHDKIGEENVVRSSIARAQSFEDYNNVAKDFKEILQKYGSK